MDSVLFHYPLKKNSLKKYKKIMNEAIFRGKEYSELCERYEIKSVKVWVIEFGGTEHAFIYHDVGEGFQKKASEWNNSKHPFDLWFNDKLMSVYDADAIDSSDASMKIADFNPHSTS